MANLATCIGYRMWIKSSNFNYFKKLEGEMYCTGVQRPNLQENVRNKKGHRTYRRS